MTALWRLGAQSTLAPEERLRLADGLFSRGLHDLALVEYTALIESVPPPESMDRIFFRAGESARHLKQPAEAAKWYARAVESGGRGDSAQRAAYRLAEQELREGKSAEVIRRMRWLLAAETEPALAAPGAYLLAQALEAGGETAEAEKVYRALLRDHAEDPLAAHAALRLAAQPQLTPEQRREHLQTALRRPPSREFEVEALWSLAALETSSGRDAEAATLYWRLWQDHADSPRVRQGMLHLAWSQMRAGEFEKALSLSAETPAIRKQEMADSWLYLEGLSLLNRGKNDEALEKLDRLLREYPQTRFRALAGYELAGLYAARGDHQRVLGLTEEILQVPGRTGDGLWLLAESARGAGEAVRAIRGYTRLTMEHPAHPRAADAAFNRAVLLESGEQEASVKAWEDFAVRFETDPRAGLALRRAGEAKIRAGDVEGGVALWQRALRLNPPDAAELQFQTALLEIRLGRETDALARLDTVLTSKPEGARLGEAQYWRGILLERGGEHARSREALTAALAAAPAADWTSAARLRLGISLRREERNPEAVLAWIPLLGSPDEVKLSDAALRWMLANAAGEQAEASRFRIAAAMCADTREAATREAGHYVRAEILLARGQQRAAAAEWEKGLAFDSGSLETAQAGIDLGNLWLQLADPARARDQFNATIRLASAREWGRLQALGMTGLGHAEAALGNWETAARHFMGVAVLFDDPELSPGNLHRASDAFTKAGQPERARAALQELQKRYPDFQTPNSP